MSLQEKTGKVVQSREGCCGGPAPTGVAACCVKDAEAKAAGEKGCGCNNATDQAGASSSDCCGSSSQTHEETGVADLNKGQHRDVLKKDEIRQAVRKQYGRVAEKGIAGCGGADYGCVPTCCGAPTTDAETLSQRLGYTSDDVNTVPSGANMGLGCGNPQAIAALKPGETVLDLGSGGGFDSFLAARQVGNAGRVIGVDMTPAMISKARVNAEKGGYQNVEFRLGEIEHLPITDGTADVIISNCVINLSPDKPQVFAEAYRVLKPGGRLAISDVVAFAELPKTVREDMALYTGCMAGASLISELETMLKKIGFVKIRVAPKDESKSLIRDWVPGTDLADYVVSAIIEAIKPAT